MPWKRTGSGWPRWRYSPPSPFMPTGAAGRPAKCQRREPVAVRKTEMDLGDRDQVTVGLISDTHGTLERALLPLLADVDVIVHAGDLLDPGELRQLTPTSGHVVVVRGNNDTPDQW